MHVWFSWETVLKNNQCMLWHCKKVKHFWLGSCKIWHPCIYIQIHWMRVAWFFCSGKSVTFNSRAKYFVPIFLPEISSALQCVLCYQSRSTVWENWNVAFQWHCHDQLKHPGVTFFSQQTAIGKYVQSHIAQLMSCLVWRNLSCIFGDSSSLGLWYTLLISWHFYSCQKTQ